jgi:class 3 adenylate cyclase
VRGVEVQVMDMLHNLFHRYDCLCEKHGIFKVETIGDGCVMAAGDVAESLARQS